MFFPFIGLVLASTISAKVIDVQVGGPSLAFSPEAVFADPGDQVVFHFGPKNHSVTQSSFANPCAQKPGGLNSGFMPVGTDVATADRPTYTIPVNDTSPIWVFCDQASGTSSFHCGKGMVFAINCGADGSPNSFTNFKNAALAIGAQLNSSGTQSPPSSTWTADYGTATIPPPPTPSLATDIVTLGSEVWTTTYSSYPNSPGPTPVSASGNIIEVKVGADGANAFSPSRVSASPRDTIKFIFMQKNHTVTQSSFSAPCMPLMNGTMTGFNSGFMPVASGTTEFPTYSLTINNTAPIWAYCAQPKHCGGGMVFAVNSDESSGRNFAAFQSLAKTLNGTTSSNSTSSNGTTTGGNTGYGNGAAPNSIGGGLVVAVVAALVGSLL